MKLQARLEAAGQLKAELARSTGEAEALREQLAAASRALWTGEGAPSAGVAPGVAAGSDAKHFAPTHAARNGSGRGPLR